VLISGEVGSSEEKYERQRSIYDGHLTVNVHEKNRSCLKAINMDIQAGIAFLYSKSRQVTPETLRLNVATFISRSWPRIHDLQFNQFPPTWMKMLSKGNLSIVH
jgi:hypothetical protein